VGAAFIGATADGSRRDMSGRIAEARCPVGADVLRMSSREPTPTILVGYDRSDPARAALVFAARQAGARGRVFVVHAYELPPNALGSPYYDRFLSDRRDRGAALLRDLPLHDGSLAGPEYEIEPLGGPAAEAIADVARAQSAYYQAITSYPVRRRPRVRGW